MTGTLSGSALPVSPEKTYVRYTEEQRRKLYDKVLRLRYGPFERGENRATWEAIAEAIGIARSTMQEWRGLDDYAQAEVRYRRMLREEGRSSASGLAQTALDHLADLMLNARSEFVQLEATKAILKITSIEKEPEEQQVDQNREMIAFQQTLAKRRAARAELAAAGFDPDRAIDAPMLPGGFLPAVVLKQNEIVAERLKREAEEIEEAEFTELPDE